MADKLVLETPQVHILASALQTTPASTIDLILTPTGDYLGWFELMAPSNIEVDSVVVQVFFSDGLDDLHKIRFAFNIGQKDKES